MHVLTVDQHLLETARARAVAERQMAVSAEQLFATLEDGPTENGDADWSFGEGRAQFLTGELS